MEFYGRCPLCREPIPSPLNCSGRAACNGCGSATRTRTFRSVDGVACALVTLTTHLNSTWLVPLHKLLHRMLKQLSPMRAGLGRTRKTMNLPKSLWMAVSSTQFPEVFQHILRGIRTVPSNSCAHHYSSSKETRVLLHSWRPTHFLRLCVCCSNAEAFFAKHLHGALAEGSRPAQIFNVVLREHLHGCRRLEDSPRVLPRIRQLVRGA